MFEHLQGQPIKPLRMFRATAALIRSYWRAIVRLIGMPVAVTFFAAYVVTLIHTVMPGTFFAGSVWLFMWFVVMVSSGAAVSCQRLVLLRESPPMPFGFVWRRREMRMTVNVVWLFLMWALSSMLVIVAMVLFGGESKGGMSVLRALSIPAGGWLLTMALGFRRIVALPRIALGLEDSHVRIGMVHLLPYLKLPEGAKALARDHFSSLFMTWALIGLVVGIAAIFALFTSGVFSKLISSKLTWMLSVIVVWYVVVAIVNTATAVLYLRLGGALTDEDGSALEPADKTKTV